ncbi:bifunctional glutamate N-acetyltransferase/amino-acid acetyltransferase ArgJ [Kozakia baliensis]|uniref:Arginine biosynthesis bifunctional protein ArgJ n=1 Tax=Kozakia baliensis TaxID=153496 RepID=A0A1D8URJ1_9PROT|nr:bifunctional glutamate N-acetyltransferase/amino-acid acetyltransferase ArgJ [Kozakia baliensis]AOX16254.1 bifunctional ornithine acetyltransferase/N-acetylglutamate synthase [Kozakia baliensis]GBR28373.1 N-acetylglutamate synthase [Kozakia baliensis NRIC 0488]GEL63697.1 arginine biosynthesis bifunctional protein ArgJ [Kozakia baliensis]
MAKAIPTSPLARPLPELTEIAGVKLGSVAAGIRYTGRDDLMMMEFTPGTTVAGVFTRNKCPAAPIDWSKAALAQGKARALLVNSGNANVFTGRAGVLATQVSAAAAARFTQCAATDVFLASTGVIGEKLPAEKIVDAMPKLYESLREDGWSAAARAIMTTDTFPKAAVREVRIGDTTVKLQGIAKGSGMIAPDMATMLGFVATDAALPNDVLQTLLHRGIETSFNAITVDSDTSTSDMVLLFATGKAGNPQVAHADDPALSEFAAALHDLLRELAILVVRDGEGATKMMTIRVTGGTSDESAKKIALAVGNSPLVKTAIAGEDANWGRIVMAVGKSGEAANRDTLSVAIGGTWIARMGAVVEGYDEAPVVAHMKEDEIDIQIDLGLANGHATIWTCDLTHGYIDINGSYRS